MGELAHDPDDVICRLVVEDPTPGPSVRAARQEHAHLCLAVCEVSCELQGSTSQSTVRTVDHVERQPGEADLLPAFAQPLRSFVSRY